MFLVTACTSGQAATASARSAPSSPAGANTKHANVTLKDKAIDACYTHTWASGDIFVRMITSGQAPVAQELGGEWTCDRASNKCVTSVESIISAVPRERGNCAQVGYVADIQATR